MKMTHILSVLVSCLIIHVPALAVEKPLVLLLAGQSNMLGQGQVAELSAEMKVMPEKVSLLVNGRAVTPFPQGSFGPEVGIAKAMAKHFPGRAIVLFKFAVGGTSQLAWSPQYDAERVKRIQFSHDVNAGALYPKLLAAWNLAFPDGTTKPDAILWMQGESDAILDEVGKEYRTHIEQLILALRRDLQAPEAPFLIGEINPPKVAASIQHVFPAVDEVVRAQRAAANELPHVFTLSTNGLGKKPDEVHYDTQGQLELGQRFALRLIEALPQR